MPGEAGISASIKINLAFYKTLFLGVYDFDTFGSMIHFFLLLIIGTPIVRVKFSNSISFFFPVILSDLQVFPLPIQLNTKS